MRPVRLALAALLAVGVVLVPLGAAPATAAPPVVGGQALASPQVLAPGAPALPTITAASFVVADLDTGEILAARAAHAAHQPASTLKVLTALTLIPRIGPDEVLVPTNADAGVDGSKVGFVPGTGYPAAEVFRAMEMVSGNDAAEVLASWGGTARRPSAG